MTDLVLKRLTPEDPSSWAYWPILEARVRRALPELEPDAKPDRVIAQLRNFWGTQPGRLGAWLALRAVERTNGHVPAPLVVAHMVAWADVYWGEPCILVYQLATERPAITPEAAMPFRPRQPDQVPAVARTPVAAVGVGGS